MTEASVAGQQLEPITISDETKQAVEARNF